MFLLAFYPLLSVLGIQLGALLTGAVITETLFQWPGLGRLLVEGILARDYPLVQGLVLFFVTIYIVMNAIVDLFAFLLDPRIRRFSL
jgi:ABC-type dipeptide/oligopeptide/nickel transport system permease component